MERTFEKTVSDLRMLLRDQPPSCIEGKVAAVQK